MPSSLRLRLTGAVMMPLAALVLLFGIITIWVTHDTEADTVDRVLVGSVRTLSLVYDSPSPERERLLPLAVHLLQRRARPVVHFSVYRGDTLLAGDPALPPPRDYRERWDGVIDAHPPATFINAYRANPLARGYINPADAKNVTQAAYLRDGTLDGKPARIATEIRRPKGESSVIVIQIADYVDDRIAYEQRFALRVLVVGLTVLAMTAILFWWAIRWGLRPLSDFTRQVESAQSDASPAFRLTSSEADPAEIRPFVEAFNGLMTRLEKASNSLRQFTSNASHQMRTPLAVARVHLDVLDRYGPLSPQGEAALQDIPHAINTMEMLLKQLIALARSEDQGDMQLRPFDLTDVAASVIGDRIAMAPSTMDIGFDQRSSGAIRALGQPALAGELLSNLLDNAIRYNDPHGTVLMSIWDEDGGAVVEIDDNGPGIAEEDRAKVWDRFYRGAVRPDAPGTGLGLPIARALADRLGATIELLDGRTGRGLCVIVRFKLASV